MTREDRQEINTILPVPPALLRKYIAYARKFCQPVLSEDAKV